MAPLQKSTVALIAIALLHAPLSADTDAAREIGELLSLVRTFQYQGRNQDAINLCNQILQADPDNVEALVERGILRLAEGQFREARTDFGSALSVRPHALMALVGRAHARWAEGDQHGAQREAERAIGACNDAINENPLNAKIYFWRGLARLVLQQDEEALRDFTEAARLDETLADAHLECAQIYRRQGKPDRALERLTEALNARPDYAVAYLARARVHFEQGDSDAAVADCTAAVAINPGYAKAWHNRGLIHLEAGDVSAAIRDLTRAIKADPDYASAHFYRGEAHLASGLIGAARADWENAREIDPDGWAGKAAEKRLKAVDSGELP